MTDGVLGFTPEVLDQLADEMRKRIPQPQPQPMYPRAGGGGGGGPTRKHALITTWQASQAGNRWFYGWEDAEYLASLTNWACNPKAGGETGSADPADGTYAINRREGRNSGAGVEGNSINMDTLPAGISFQPVGGGTAGVVAHKVPVIMTLDPIIAQLSQNVDMRWQFDYENAVDGTCA